MELHPTMSLMQFRDEVQHRVVKFAPRSRPVRQAVAFARRQADPEFLRLALKKLHAQERYLAQTEGPSRWQRLTALLHIASLPELAVTLALVATGCLVIESFRAWQSDQRPAQVSDAELERLAQRLGFTTEARTGRLAPRGGNSTPAGDTADGDASKKLDPRMELLIDKSVERRIRQAVSEQVDRRLAVWDAREEKPAAGAPPSAASRPVSGPADAGLDNDMDQSSTGP